MIRVFDFKCQEGHVSEHFVENETAVACPACERLAFRQLAAPRSRLEGITGDFPTAADAWVNRRESHMKKERKDKENHGTYWTRKPDLI